MNSDRGWGSMWFGFPLLGKNKATICAVSCEPHPDEKSHADTNLVIRAHARLSAPAQQMLTDVLPQSPAGQCPAYWALQWLSHFCRSD